MPSSRIKIRLARLGIGLTAAMIFGAGSALAEGNTIGVSIASQRAPDNFDESVATVTGVSYTHAFDNDWLIEAAMTYFDVSHSDTWHLNSHVDVGYRFHLSDVVSLVGVAAIGSRAQNDATDFPYYMLHGAVDWKIFEAVTWSVVTLRYRNAFNTVYKFETPAIGSALGFRLSDSHSISLNYLREWDEGKVVDNLFGIGYQYHF